MEYCFDLEIRPKFFHQGVLDWLEIEVKVLRKKGAIGRSHD